MATSTFSPGRLTTSSVPLPTPFWFSGAGSAPASCPASVINPGQSSTAYCCDGLLIDITQPILGSVSQQQPFYFEDLRCCSGDPDVALGSVTSCSTGTAAMLATSVAQVTSSQGSSSMIQSEMGGISTSTKTETRQVQITTTATAAAPSTSESEGRIQRVGTTIYLLTFLCLWLNLTP